MRVKLSNPKTQRNHGLNSCAARRIKKGKINQMVKGNGFPGLLELVERAEQSNWNIGEWLRDNMDKESPLIDCAEYLAECGFADYTASRLHKFREMAITFPKSRRKKLSFGVHSVARTPERLDEIVRVAKEEGKKVTQEFVADINKTQKLFRGLDSEDENPPFIEGEARSIIRSCDLIGLSARASRAMREIQSEMKGHLPQVTKEALRTAMLEIRETATGIINRLTTQGSERKHLHVIREKETA
jgi:hypothetical protein